MANENLFPQLDWSNWDNLSVSHNNQKYDSSVTNEIFDDLQKKYTKVTNDLANKSWLKEGESLSSPNSVSKRLELCRLQQSLRDQIFIESKYSNSLTPYSYVPPRHALEPHLGFEVNPNNAYRLIGEVITKSPDAPNEFFLKNKTKALEDFLETGQIRGNPRTVNGGRIFYDIIKELPQAYFMPRHPQPAYYTTSQVNDFVGQNTMIEINKDFAPINQKRIPSSSNPLYYMGDQRGIDAQKFRERGGSWAENTGAGAHITVNPRKNIPFLDMINPANRKGIRILQETTPALSTIDKTAINQRAIYGMIKIDGKPDNFILPDELSGTAPEASKIKWTTKYDRITPFSKRPISTHLANLNAETEIFYNASKTAPLSTNPASLGAMAGLGGTAKAVGLVAGGFLTPLQIGMQINALTKKNMMDREYGYSDPFALRPMVDLALSGIGNNQTPAQGYRDMGKMVADPEWQMRNPLSAVPYNLLQGNLEPLKAFAGGLKDFYTPNFLK